MPGARSGYVPEIVVEVQYGQRTPDGRLRFPRFLPVAPRQDGGGAWTDAGCRTIRVEVEGRDLELSNLDKVLYPAAGFTKGEVIDYYTRIAPVLLPHLRDRALTRIRYPNGVDGAFFFEKNAPGGTPDWVRLETLPVPGSTKDRETIDFVVVDDLPTLVWLANLAALELHTPQWRVAPRRRARRPDGGRPRPGRAGRRCAECCAVAVLMRDRLAEDGIDSYPKTSGQEGHAALLPDRRHPVGGRGLRVRQAGRRGAGAGRPEADHREDGEAAAARQDLHRLEPEQRGEDDGGAVLAAGPAARRPSRRR